MGGFAETLWKECQPSLWAWKLSCVESWKTREGSFTVAQCLWWPHSHGCFFVVKDFPPKILRLGLELSFTFICFILGQKWTFDAWKKVQTGRFGGSSNLVSICIFLLDSSAFLQVPPLSTLPHASEVHNPPHLTSIFQKVKKKVRVLLSRPPGTEETNCGARRREREKDTGRERSRGRSRKWW